MFYVVFECETAYSEETPKDHTRVSALAYQIISVDTLKPKFEESRKYVTDSSHSLQSLVQSMDMDVKNIVGEEEFVLCSLYSTWDLRVTLQRQARDESWLLPSFLQHPKIFDMWKEVARWCDNHREIFADQKGQHKREKSIGELVRVLQLGGPVDVQENESRDKEALLSQFLNLAPVDQCHKILLALHEKCTTNEDDTLVLTHPYDSFLDIKNFLQERSKVLYMNNLPPDTTQSELESWFTQFGSRPVGFWTVKNVVEDTSNINNNWSSNNNMYVDEQDSISGFVIYQTHEEALDSLILNGRSILSNMSNTKQPRVVEHVVEIQPSSTRVLDRAQEILSPFPQSKNKPRPGDWTCPSCSFSNFQRRTACFRCSFPIASATPVNKGYKSTNHGTIYKSRTPAATQSADYVDTLQTHQQVQNIPHHQHQQNSQNSQILVNSLSGQLTPQDPNHTMLQLHNQDMPRRQKYNQQSVLPLNQQSQQNGMPNGSNVPFRAGDWKCISCTYHNFAKNVVCLRCGGPKTGNNDDSNGNQQIGSSVAGTISMVNLPARPPTANAGDIYGNPGFSGISLNGRSSSEPNWNGAVSNRF